MSFNNFVCSFYKPVFYIIHNIETTTGDVTNIVTLAHTTHLNIVADKVHLRLAKPLSDGSASEIWGVRINALGSVSYSSTPQQGSTAIRVCRCHEGEGLYLVGGMCQSQRIHDFTTKLCVVKRWSMLSLYLSLVLMWWLMVMNSLYIQQ